MTTFAFTGHRPKDLPVEMGIHFGMGDFRAALDPFLRERNDDTPSRFITGGALGIDTFAAEYAIQRGFPLTLALPFEPEVMARFWSEYQRMTLIDHVARATEVVIIHPGDYNVAAYQRRNEYMVDNADMLIAFWTGKRFGGTFNAIEYARKVGKPTVNLLRM